MAESKIAHRRDIALFALAYALLIFMIWASELVARRPYEGFNWDILTGHIINVDPSGPAYGVLNPADIIVALNGTMPEDAIPLYDGLQPGSPVEFAVLRNGLTNFVTINLIQAPLGVVIQRMIVFIVSFMFWIVGVGVLAFSRERKQAVVFVLWCLLVSSMLSAGSLSPTGPPWVSCMFNVLLWFAGPVSVHLHLVISKIQLPKKGLVLLGAMYGLSVIGSLPYILWGSIAFKATRLGELFYTAALLETSFGLLYSIPLLVYAYRRTSEAHVRRQIRLLILSWLVGLMPIVVFDLLPLALLNRQLIPEELGILFIAVVPLGYGYAVSRHQLMRLDRFLNRAAASSFIAVIMVGSYLGLLNLKRVLLPESMASTFLAEATLVLLLGAMFYVTQKWVRIFIDWIFYGGWYDFRSAVERIVEVINVVEDPQDLARRLSQRVCEILRLDHVCLLLLGPSGEICGCDGTKCFLSQVIDQANVTPISLLPENGTLRNFIQHMTMPMTTEELRTALADVRLSAGEQILLSDMEQKIWQPIPGKDTLLGIIVLGSKRGNEPFGSVDLAILGVVAKHVSTQFQNMVLLHELEQRANDVEKLHREIMRTREEERKMLSRELHDSVIQALVGLNYKLAQGDGVKFSHLSADVRSIIQTIRQMCQQLRPPTLDSLGLVAAVQARLREFKAESEDPPALNLHIKGDEELPVPDDVAICLYRTLNEALVNIRKHACAKRVLVELDLAVDEVSLTIDDDGVGFLMPQKLGQLLNDDHFGLVGMRERLELVHGTLEISTSLGKGVRVRASVPLDSKKHLEELSKEKVIS
jgi:signal transduction histidine kinase